MNIPLGFAIGILVGAVATFFLFKILKGSSGRTARQQVAPNILNIEINRAKRIGYSLAIMIFKVPVKQFDSFKDWLEGAGEKIRIRDYDLVLEWSEEELIIILPGSGKSINLDKIRSRFDELLKESGWASVKYGLSLFPDDSDKSQNLVEKARKDLNT